MSTTAQSVNDAITELRDMVDKMDGLGYCQAKIDHAISRYVHSVFDGNSSLTQDLRERVVAAAPATPESFWLHLMSQEL